MMEPGEGCSAPFSYLGGVVLALKYRPKVFSEVIGQDESVTFLAHMALKDKLPNLMIFKGVHGSGKTSTARIVAAAMMNCSCNNGEECISCNDIFNGVSLTVTEIDAASHGKVADMEALRESLFYSNGHDNRLVILDEAHAISREGFKSMLKTFEEAPPGVKFILVTTEFRRIPETIVSRAMVFPFNRVATEDIVSRLEHVNLMEGLKMEEDLVRFIAESSNGVVRDALMLMDKISRVEITTLSNYMDVTGRIDIGPVLMNAMIKDGVAGGFREVAKILKTTGDAEIIPEALTNVLRDVMLLRQDMPVAWQGEALNTRKTLASQLDLPTITNSLRVLWDLKTKFRHSEAYYEVNLAIAMIGELFEKPTSGIVSAAKVASTPAPVARKLSLDELGMI